MKKAELKVGARVWIGRKYGCKEGYVLSTDPRWSERKWRSRDQSRYYYDEVLGKGVAVAVQGWRFIDGERTAIWEPEVVSLNLMQPYENHQREEEQRDEWRANSARVEQERRDARAVERDTFDRRIGDLLGDEGGKYVQTDKYGSSVTLTQVAFDRILAAAEKAQLDRLLDLEI